MTNPFILDFFDVRRGRTRSADARWSSASSGARAEILARLEAAGFEPGYVTADVEDRKPKLHLKAQLVLSREAEEVLKKMDWPTLMDAFITQSMKQVHDRSQYVSAKEAWIANERIWDEQLDALARDDDARGARRASSPTCPWAPTTWTTAA